MIMRGKVKPPRDFDKIDYDAEECSETDKAVNAFPQEYRAVIFQHYISRGTAEQQANTLRCSVKTVYNRLDRAEDMLLGLMNDVAAALPPRLYDKFGNYIDDLL